MTVEGLDRLQKKLTVTIPDNVRAKMRDALARNAQKIVTSMKAFAPIDSGDLRRSIGFTFGAYVQGSANVRGMQADGKVGDITVPVADPDLTVTIHAGDEQAWYARLVEFGTRPHNVQKGGGNKSGILAWKFGGTDKKGRKPIHHPGAAPHPFFYPAYRMHRRSVKRSIATALRRAIKEIGK